MIMVILVVIMIIITSPVSGSHTWARKLMTSFFKVVVAHHAFTN